jgi:hypothetical protein
VSLLHLVRQHIKRGDQKLNSLFEHGCVANNQPMVRLCQHVASHKRKNWQSGGLTGAAGGVLASHGA